MRHVTFYVFFILASGFGDLAFGAPFDPALVPEQVQVVGHLDVDALRRTQLYAELGGDAAIDPAIADAPAQFRPALRTLSKSIQGVTFWHDGDHGALYVETRSARAVSKLLGDLPSTPARAIDGVACYVLKSDHDPAYAAGVGETLVLADTTEALERSLHVLRGKAQSLVGTGKLPLSSHQGVFMFVTIDDNMLGAIQKAARSKMLHLSVRSLVIDVGEASGVVTASARAEMGSADAVLKAKSILDGLRALASLSDEPTAKVLLDGLTLTSSGHALEIADRMSVAELARLIRTTK
jgi:hypothetical protein